MSAGVFSTEALRSGKGAVTNKTLFRRPKKQASPAHRLGWPFSFLGVPPDGHQHSPIGQTHTGS